MSLKSSDICFALKKGEDDIRASYSDSIMLLLQTCLSSVVLTILSWNFHF